MASYASPPAYKKFAKDCTHAAVNRRLSSTSSLSKVEDAFNQNIQVLWQPSRWNLEKCEKTNSYHLGDLTQSSTQATLGESDRVWCTYLFPPPTYKCVKRQVQVFTLLPELFCTLKVMPDVCVYPVMNGKEIPVPALLVEVHSSHFRDSMRKCILGVIEQLRLYRTANPDISSCIGFTFSKLPSASTDNLKSVIQDTSDCHMGEFPVLL